MIPFLHFPSTVGYAGVALLVGAESAGVPVPGETSLIDAAVLASQGHLSLPIVITVAAGAAIVGDNVGYAIGRRGGRWLLARPGRWERSRGRLLARAEAFYARHGPAAVFLGRWVPWLRVTAAWLAGANRRGRSRRAGVARPRSRRRAAQTQVASATSGSRARSVAPAARMTAQRE